MDERQVPRVWLTERELAEREGVSERTVRAWRQQGLLRGHRPPGRDGRPSRLVRYRVDDVEAFERSWREVRA